MKTRFSDLIRVMQTLRSPGGCPWDRKQTAETLKPYLLEEAYEVLEAIDQGDPETVKEELGDLLFQVLFHSRIAQERGDFDIGGVIEQTIDKMVRRHPHVFGSPEDKKGGGKKPSADEVLANWEAIKLKEKKNRQRKSVLDGVPKTLPGLMRATQLQNRAARVGFDWDDVESVWEKVREEIGELDKAVRNGSRDEMQAEFGDVLFSLVNLARFLKIDPEDSLRRSNDRFTRRFHFVEKEAGKTEGGLSGMTLKEMDRHWERAKQAERRSGKRGA